MAVIAAVVTISIASDFAVSATGSTAIETPTKTEKGTDSDTSLCGVPVLRTLKPHKVQSDETLESIAKKYKLTTATIMGLNPQSRNGEVEVGQVLDIPPVNGMTYQVGKNESYKAIASKYSIRPDVLFERNGCEPSPKVVFIPGAVWKPNPVIAKLPDFINPNNTPEIVILGNGGYPLPYAVPITSSYGWRSNPVTGEWLFHSGIDLGAPMGTPVLAAKSGRVEVAGWSGGYGNLIELSHESSGTRYAHLSEIHVTPGQQIAKGQQIGLVGSTGRSTGPHLHFEILTPTADGWLTSDPAPYLNGLASNPQPQYISEK